jgi:hypothetical protein
MFQVARAFLERPGHSFSVLMKDSDYLICGIEGFRNNILQIISILSLDSYRVSGTIQGRWKIVA